MKVKPIEFKQEGFTACRALEFENGLVLRSPSVLWAGKVGREEAEKQFAAVIEAIKNNQLSFGETSCDGSPTASCASTAQAAPANQ